MLPLETKILESDKEILTQLANLVDKAEKQVSVCSPIGGFQLIDDLKPLLQSYKNLLKRLKTEKVQEGIRWVTHIENSKEQVTLVKRFIDIGIHIRHLEVPPINFYSISETVSKHYRKNDRWRDDTQCPS